MTVQQIIDLANSEPLAQLAVNSDNDAIIGWINLGLIDLYKKFKLRTEEHLVTLVEGQTIYTMPNDYMTIVAAYDEVPEYADYEVAPIPINEEDNPLSINAIGYNQVQVPITTNGAYISIIYSAKPEVVLDGDNLAEEVPLPPQLTDALLEYIGYKGHKSLDNGVQSEAAKRLNDYDTLCTNLLLDGEGSTADDMSMRNRLSTRGFV